VTKIVTYPDERLLEPCAWVPYDDEGAVIVKGFLALAQPVLERTQGLAVAANQIGLLYRIVALPHRHFVNPVVYSLFGEKIPVNEGCLSLPGVFEYVERYQGIEIEWTELVDGEWKEHRKSYFYVNPNQTLSHILQHEMEHLDGKLFLDNLPKNARKRAYRKYTEKHG